MKLKTSFFNCGLLKSNLKRFWPLFTAYFVVLLLAIPMSAMNNGYEGTANSIIFTLRDYLDVASVMITFIMAISTAMGVYGFMYSQRTCGLIASLPLKRKTILATAAFSGIVPVLAINLIVGIITAISLIASPDKLAMEALLIWFAVTSMHYITFFGIASIIAVITGNIVALPVFYFIFNFLANSLEAAIREVFSEFIFGFTASVSEMSFDFLAPFIYLTNHEAMVCTTHTTPDAVTITSVSYSQWYAVIAFAVAGLAFIVASILIFRKRKMENCGDVIAVPSLRPIFKYGVAVCAAMANAILLRGIFGVSDIAALDAWLYVLYLILGAFIGYFGSEMLLQKSFNVFRGRWLGFFVLAVLCVGFVWGCITDIAGLATRTPVAADVDHVVISTVSYGDDLKLQEASSIDSVIALNNSIIENKDVHISSTFDKKQYISIAYHLASGRIVSREYGIDMSSADFNRYKQILSSNEAMEYYTTPGVPVTEEHVAGCSFTYFDPISGEYNYIELEPAQAVDFFKNAYTADVTCGNIKYYEENFDYSTYIEIQFNNTEADETYDRNHLYYYCYISPECENCIQWLIDNLGVDLNNYFG